MIMQAVSELWFYYHFEQNGDYPTVNDCARWAAYVYDGLQYLSCSGPGVTTVAVVTGDLASAHEKLKELLKSGYGDWPSIWLGPKDESTWCHICAALNLSFVRTAAELPAVLPQNKG